MADTPTGNYDWFKVIAGIGPNQVIKVLNTLRSTLQIGIDFLYPYQNDNKKLRFTIKGLKLAKYLVTVLGTNIKKVTWDGDQVELSFQGGSRSYLEEDTNETEGDYDSLNSAVSVIDKIGPLDNNAPYIIEFRKEPKPEEWANFMISCQGIGSSVQISDLYTTPVGEDGTVIDDYYNNDYSTTTEMTPNYNGSTFTPVTPGSTTLLDWGLHSILPGSGSASTLGCTIGCGSASSSGQVDWQLTSAPAGYYMVNIMVLIVTDATPTVTSTFSTASNLIDSKYAVAADERSITLSGGKYAKLHTATYCCHLTQAVTSGTTVFSTKTVGYNNAYDAFGQLINARALSQAEFQALRPSP